MIGSLIRTVYFLRLKAENTAVTKLVMVGQSMQLMLYTTPSFLTALNYLLIYRGFSLYCWFNDLPK